MRKKDEKKTKAQLIDELNLLRERLAKLDREKSVAVGLGKDASPAKTDISAQEELVRMRKLLRNVLDSVPSALICMNLDRRITHWNQKAAELLGVMKKDAIGLKIGEVFPQLDLIKPGLENAIQSRQTRELNNVLIYEEPEPRFGDVIIYPLFSDNIEGALIHIDDATARIHTQEMLIQSEKMFSVGGLAAGMAQEINNPLAGVVQSIRVMQNRLIGDLEPNIAAASECGTTLDTIHNYLEKRQVTTLLDNVLNAGDRALKILQNILNFSSKGDEFTDHYPIASLLDQTVELAANDYNLRKLFDFKGIDIIRKYDQNIPMIPYSCSKIQQVFLNILKNGVEAMSYGNTEKPKFELRVLAENQGVRIEIEDNGPGMTSDISERVFEPFFSTKQNGFGAGLGLYVSYFIVVENHGGSLNVKSSPNHGTTFAINLPRPFKKNNDGTFWESNSRTYAKGT